MRIHDMEKKGRLTLLVLLMLGLAACAGEEGSSPPPPTGTATATAVPPTQTSIPTASPASTAVPAPGSQANADVLFVRAAQTGDERWTFSVTVQHPDTGWEDYADGWDVVLADGRVAKSGPDDPFTRLLVHPHVAEQPFTRSQNNIYIPADVTEVTVRAHDLVDGWGGEEISVDLTAVSGPGFEVER